MEGQRNMKTTDCDRAGRGGGNGKEKKKGNGEGKRYANMMTSSMREEKAEREEKQERSHIKHRGRKCTIRIPVQKRGITGLKIKNK